MKTRNILLIALISLACGNAWGQEELIKYGDFESWLTRSVKDSKLVGGKLWNFEEVGPAMTWPQNKAYTNQGGSQWATSNVYAKVAGIAKCNVSVYHDTHNGGKCAKLTTQLVSCKAVGIVNVTVIAAGSLFLGEMVEPITGASNPMSKMSSGIPFTKRPKALKFDYKVKLTGEKNRIRETGFGKRKEVPGVDQCEALCLLQKRWEEPDGSIHALRVGTMWKRFILESDWKTGATFDIHYGDITGEKTYYRSYMGLQGPKSERVYWAKNSKGKMVMIEEDGWAEPDEAPTHMIVFFNSSHGGAYIGSPGNTMWVDNVKLVY